MNGIEKLAKYFSRFPGIGERQSKRFAFFLLSAEKSYLDELIRLMQGLKNAMSQCRSCFRYFPTGDRDLCPICVNPDSDKSMLMIVEKDTDCDSVIKSGYYKGQYFILGNLVPIVEKDSPKKIRLNELLEKIKSGKELKEIILAFSLNPQGENTDIYIREKIRDLCETLGIKISSLGRGLSTGTELEYSDSDTLKNALKNRQ